jgi:hypothetical protein
LKQSVHTILSFSSFIVIDGDFTQQIEWVISCIQFVEYTRTAAFNPISLIVLGELMIKAVFETNVFKVDKKFHKNFDWITYIECYFKFD